MPKKHTQSLKTRKRRGPDLDELYSDLRTGKAQKVLEQPTDPDLPGEGKFYCCECATYYHDQTSLVTHTAGKPHKRRLKALQDVPYSIEESKAAGGSGCYDRAKFGLGPLPNKKQKKNTKLHSASIEIDAEQT